MLPTAIRVSFEKTQSKHQQDDGLGGPNSCLSYKNNKWTTNWQKVSLGKLWTPMKEAAEILQSSKNKDSYIDKHRKRFTDITPALSPEQLSAQNFPEQISAQDFLREISPQKEKESKRNTASPITTVNACSLCYWGPSPTSLHQCRIQLMELARVPLTAPLYQSWSSIYSETCSKRL